MLTIRIDASEVKRWTAAAGNQLPYATMLAINRTAKMVKDEIREEMVRVFNRPKPVTLNSLVTTMATKHSLEGSVWIKDTYEYDEGIPFINYIGPNIFGGSRHAKAYELALRRAGILRNDMFTVAGKDAPLDQYGNIPRGLIMQMLSGLSANRDVGVTSNITTASRKRNKRRAMYFLMGNPFTGVYTRQNGELKSFLKFVKAPLYQPRLDFFGVGQRVIDEHLVNETVIAIEEALRTAR